MATATHFLVVKDGTDPNDNDDSAASSPQGGRFAISDGACESGFSKIWSRVLVDEFVLRCADSANDWSQWFERSQAQWCEELKDTTIPWYGEEQFQRGAFATFLGVVLVDDVDLGLQYHAEAVGDSCLFHTRAGELLHAFPVEKSADFGVLPTLVGSRTPVQQIVDDRRRSIEAALPPDDRLLLMSDALAQWSLAEAEADRPPWQEINDLVRKGCDLTQFESWVENLRSKRGLHNDDVTLMLIDPR